MKAIFVFALAALFVVSTFAVPLPICPAENGEYVTLIENPDDCRTYYSCNDGIPYLMQCYEGLLFNPVLKVCDWPQNVICARPSTQQPDVTTPGPEVSTNGPEVTTNGPEVSTNGPEVTTNGPEIASSTA